MERTLFKSHRALRVFSMSLSALSSNAEARSASPVLPQEILRIVDGRWASKIVVPHYIEDMDGDGVGDILVEGAFSFGQGAGTYFVHSGVSGEMIWGPYYPSSPSTGLFCGQSHASVLGDFDGDGITDIAVSCGTLGGSAGNVNVLSGLDGHLIVNIPNPVPGLVAHFGYDVGALGDVNGDGFADLIISGSEPRQDVYAGPNGTFLYSVFGPTLTFSAGRGIGDITGDGLDDFLIGWRSSGLATVHSGADGSIVTQFCMSHNGSNACAGNMGPQPVKLGDVTGDGVPDFAIANPDITFAGDGGGVLQVYSGADFSIVHHLSARRWGAPYELLRMGHHLAGGNDINGDGVPDLVTTSAQFFSIGYFSAISGRTGQVIYRVRSHWQGGILPFSVNSGGCATLDDINGDGYGDWAVCDPTFSGVAVNAGRMVILSGGAGDVESICDGVAHSLGHPAKIVFNGPPTEGTRELQIEVEEGVPDAAGHILYGLEHAPTVFGDGILCIDPLSRINYGDPFRLDASGFVSVLADWGRPEIASGPTAWTAGSTWVVQAAFRDPGGTAGFNTTNAVRVLFNR